MTREESNARRICCPMCDKDKCDREADDCDVKKVFGKQMKILIVEYTAEELKANRTVMDNVNEALNNFTDSLFGVNNIDFTNMNEEDSEE